MNLSNKDTQLLINRAKDLCRKYHRRHICEDILFGAFFPVCNLSAALILDRFGISEDLLSDSSQQVLSELKPHKSIGFGFSPKVKNILFAAECLAKSENEEIYPYHILGAMYLHMPAALKYFDISSDDLSKGYLDFLSDEPIEYTGDSVFDDSAPMFSENPILSQYAQNLNLQASNGEFDDIIDYDNKVDELITILCKKQKPNPILIGEAGVGKTSLVQLLAQRIVNKQVPDLLANKVIYSLSLSSMIAGTEYRGQFEKRMEDLVQELKKYNNLIVFIDEIHTLVGAGNTQENTLDASNILKPDLARGTISCIGATTISEYKKTIKKDAALDRRFEKVIVREPSSKEMEKILPIIIKQYSQVHKVNFTDCFLDSIISYCDKFLPNRKYPDKIVDVIDTCGAKVKVNHYNLFGFYKKEGGELLSEDTELTKEKILSICEKIQNAHKTMNEKIPDVTKKDLEDYFKRHSNPIYKLCYNDKLQQRFKKSLVGQSKACKNFINGLQKTLYGVDVIKSEKSPSAFLIYGPEGSGKTLFCDVIADILEEEGVNIIKLSGLELSGPYAKEKIVSDYPNDSSVAERVSLNPTSCIIIDNFQQCDIGVQGLIKRILNKGYLSLSSGDIADFSNTQLIITCDSTSQKTMGFAKNQDEPTPAVDLGNSCYHLPLEILSEKSLRRFIYNKLIKISSNISVWGPNRKIEFDFDFLKKFAAKAIKEDKKYIHQMFSTTIPNLIIEQINKNSNNNIKFDDKFLK